MMFLQEMEYFSKIRFWMRKNHKHSTENIFICCNTIRTSAFLMFTKNACLEGATGAGLLMLSYMVGDKYRADVSLCTGDDTYPHSHYQKSAYCSTENIETYSWLGEGRMPSVVGGALPTDQWGGPKGFSAHVPNITSIAAFVARMVAIIPLFVVAAYVAVNTVTQTLRILLLVSGWRAA